MNESHLSPHLLAHVAPRLCHRGQTVPVASVMEGRCSSGDFLLGEGEASADWNDAAVCADGTKTRQTGADRAGFIIVVHPAATSCPANCWQLSADTFEHVKRVSPRLHLRGFVVPEPELFLSFGRKSHNFTSYTKGSKCKCPKSVLITSKIMEKIVRYWIFYYLRKSVLFRVAGEVEPVCSRSDT